MKTLTKKLLLVFALFVFTIQTYAQSKMSIDYIISSGQSYGGDFKVPQSVPYSNSNWDKLEKSQTFGINTGVAFSYYFNDNIGTSLGLLYSHQGQQHRGHIWSMDNSWVTYDRGTSLNYLKVPVQFHYILNPNKSDLSFIFSAGFYLGFLLKYEINDEFAGSDKSRVTSIAKGSTLTKTLIENNEVTTQSAAFVNGNPFKKNDFGGILGFGIQLKLSDKISVPIMLNYTTGFMDVKNKTSQFTLDNVSNAKLYWQNDNNDSPNATLAYRNSFWGIGIGLKYNL